MATHRELHQFTNAQLKMFTHKQLNTLSIDELMELSNASVSAIGQKNSELGEKLGEVQKFFKKLYRAYTTHKLISTISADAEADANNETSLDDDITLNFDFDFKEMLSAWAETLKDILFDLTK